MFIKILYRSCVFGLLLTSCQRIAGGRIKSSTQRNKNVPLIVQCWSRKSLNTSIPNVLVKVIQSFISEKGCFHKTGRGEFCFICSLFNTNLSDKLCKKYLLKEVISLKSSSNSLQYVGNEQVGHIMSGLLKVYDVFNPNCRGQKPIQIQDRSGNRCIDFYSVDQDTLNVLWGPHWSVQRRKKCGTDGEPKHQVGKSDKISCLENKVVLLASNEGTLSGLDFSFNKPRFVNFQLKTIGLIESKIFNPGNNKFLVQTKDGLRYWSQTNFSLLDHKSIKDFCLQEGPLVVTASAKKLKLWDVSDISPILLDTFKTGQSNVCTCAQSISLQKFAVGLNKGSVWIFSIETGKIRLIHRIKVANKPVQEIAITEKGTLVVSTSKGRKLYLYKC